MTEEESRKKWCPFARVSGTNSSYNRGAILGEDTGQAQCVGSACMAWRWNYIVTEEPTEGYCGLAGKP